MISTEYFFITFLFGVVLGIIIGMAAYATMIAQI